MPLVGLGASALGGFIGSKLGKSGKSSSGGGDDSDLSRTLANYSKDQYQLARPALTQALGMYSKLATGNRADIQGVIAPQVSMINDNYRGAGKYLEQQGVRGGERDYAMAELNRQKTGQIGTLPMTARMGAVDSLAELGSRGTMGAMGSMGNIFSTLANIKANKDMSRQQMWGQLGGGVASSILPWLLGKYGGGSGGGGR